MERWRSAAIWVMKATVQQLARHRIHLYKAVHIPCKAQKKWADTWSSLGTSITLKELRLPCRPRRYQPTQDRTTNQNRVAHRMGPAELQRWPVGALDHTVAVRAPRRPNACSSPCYSPCLLCCASIAESRTVGISKVERVREGLKKPPSLWQVDAVVKVQQFVDPLLQFRSSLHSV